MHVQPLLGVVLAFVHCALNCFCSLVSYYVLWALPIFLNGLHVNMSCHFRLLPKTWSLSHC